MTQCHCFQADSITFEGGPITAITNYGQVAAAEQWKNGNCDLHFEYISPSVREDLTGIALLHLSVIRFDRPTNYTLTVQSLSGTWNLQRTVIFDQNLLHGWAFSVPVVGNYTIAFESTAGPGLAGYLYHSDGMVFAADNFADNFYDYAEGVAGTPRPDRSPQASATVAKSPHATAQQTEQQTAEVSGTIGPPGDSDSDSEQNRDGDPPEEGSHTPAIVGGFFGGLIALIVIVAVVCLFWRRGMSSSSEEIRASVSHQLIFEEHLVIETERCEFVQDNPLHPFDGGDRN
jgi:hypothetical protein